jgi:hypothetical protein
MPTRDAPTMINFADNHCVWADGRSAKFGLMLDFRNEVTNDVDEAELITVQHPDGGWQTIKVCDYEPVTKC